MYVHNICAEDLYTSVIPYKWKILQHFNFW